MNGSEEERRMAAETLATMVYQVRGRVAHLILNRPTRGNGITFQMPRYWGRRQGESGRLEERRRSGSQSRGGLTEIRAGLTDPSGIDGDPRRSSL